jgi:hypothetical protein
MFPKTSIQSLIEGGYSKCYNENGCYGKDTFLTGAQSRRRAQSQFALNVAVRVHKSRDALWHQLLITPNNYPTSTFVTTSKVRTMESETML